MISLLVSAALAVGHAAQSAPSPAIVSVARIWDAGAHNAFTDLIRWRDRWYCTFREGDEHVGGDGRIRVLESTDGQAWTSAALVGETGIDLRDASLGSETVEMENATFHDLRPVPDPDAARACWRERR